jgi:hypothetical protein
MFLSSGNFHETRYASIKMYHSQQTSLSLRRDLSMAAQATDFERAFLRNVLNKGKMGPPKKTSNAVRY